MNELIVWSSTRNSLAQSDASQSEIEKKLQESEQRLKDEIQRYTPSAVQEILSFVKKINGEAPMVIEAFKDADES